MLSATILSYSRINQDSGTNSDTGASIKDLSLRVTGTGEKFKIVTAEFNLASVMESNGEIRILVDGNQMVNNRIILKKGDAHYSVEFMMPCRETYHVYSAVADLRVNGEGVDITKTIFGVSAPAIAESDRY